MHMKHSSTSWGSLVRAQYGASHGEPDPAPTPQAPTPRTARPYSTDPSPQRLDGVLPGLLAALAVMLLAGLSGATNANAAPIRWQGPVIATWYGPGFYGNTMACGNRLTRQTRGVAHRTLPCGTRLTIRWGGRQRWVTVVDRGPYSGATFDLTSRTAQDLCSCWRPFTLGTGNTPGLRWTRGWTITTPRSTT